MACRCRCRIRLLILARHACSDRSDGSLPCLVDGSRKSLENMPASLRLPPRFPPTDSSNPQRTQFDPSAALVSSFITEKKRINCNDCVLIIWVPATQ